MSHQNGVALLRDWQRERKGTWRETIITESCRTTKDIGVVRCNGSSFIYFVHMLYIFLYTVYRQAKLAENTRCDMYCKWFITQTYYLMEFYLFVLILYVIVLYGVELVRSTVFSFFLHIHSMVIVLHTYWYLTYLKIQRVGRHMENGMQIRPHSHYILDIYWHMDKVLQIVPQQSHRVL